MEFNAVNYSILNIPGYLFFAGIGLVISISGFIMLLFKNGYSLQKNIRILFVAAICAIVSARLFGCFSGIYRDLGTRKGISWEGVKNTGIVYYGGLLGLLASYRIGLRWTKQDIHILDILAIIIPLFHSLARIGCFVGGCCYGKAYSCYISIQYTTVVFDQIITVQRIPTQLIEAIFNFVMFIYLLYVYSNFDWKAKHILKRYVIGYSFGRFIIEFFRGDAARGILCGISFSQLISVIIWLYFAFITGKGFKARKRK